MEVSNLKEFIMFNAYATGNSYVSALFDESKILTNTISDALVYARQMVTSFSMERTGSTCKWDYYTSNTYSAFREMLEYSDLDYLQRILDEFGKCEYHVNNCFILTINADYSVSIKVYAFINISATSIGWMDEEQGKLMIARKISFLKKP